MFTCISIDNIQSLIPLQQNFRLLILAFFVGLRCVVFDFHLLGGGEISFCMFFGAGLLACDLTVIISLI